MAHGPACVAVVGQPVPLRRVAASGRSEPSISRSCTMSFSISSDVLDSLQRHVTFYGLKDTESGAFLLGPYDTESITVLALAEGVGVERGRGFFRVSGKAI